jgi:hypothetical protein
MLREGSDQRYLADHAINVDALHSALLSEESVSAIADIDIADVDELVAAIQRHELAGSGTGQLDVGESLCAGMASVGATRRNRLV